MCKNQKYVSLVVQSSEWIRPFLSRPLQQALAWDFQFLLAEDLLNIFWSILP